MTPEDDLEPEDQDSGVPRPDGALLARFGKAQYAPSYDALPNDEQDALDARLITVAAFEDLSPEDQAFLLRCEAEVNAGASAWLQTTTGSLDDWQAEDAREDADDAAAAEAKALPDDVWAGW